MNFEKEQPLEARLEQRVGEVSAGIKETADLLREQGFSERAMAGYLSTLEYMNNLMNANVLPGSSQEDKEHFITELQAAIRTLSHGLTMGDTRRNQEKRDIIANGHGKLWREIDEAVSRTTGKATEGPGETVMKTEGRL